MAAASVNKVVAVEINTDEDLKNWAVKVADMLRQLSDDLELVEAQLGGKLRNVKVVEGNANAKARNVIMHVKQARLMSWAARKSVLGVYKAFLKQFAQEIDQAKKPKKPTEGLKITP